MTTRVARWVQELVEDVVGHSPCEIGKIYLIQGRPCRIISGQYWGEHGISNFWSWRQMLLPGHLGPEEHGYGGDWPELTEQEAAAMLDK